MSRTILDELTRALFAHLRGGNACFDEENELSDLFRRCPRCSRSLRPLILDKFTEDNDGQQYERMWWTCPGIEQKQCFFPLDIPKEVFWTRRSMEQSLRGILPLPNLHLLPRSLHALYPKLFDRNINIERIVELSAFVPPDEQKEVAAQANLAAEEQPEAQVEEFVADTAAAVPSLLISFPSLPSSVRYCISIETLLTPPNSVKSRSPVFCDGISHSSRFVSGRQTVHSFLKENFNKRLFGRNEKASSVERDEQRKVVDLNSNANAALNSHLLLKSSRDSKWMVNSLNLLDPTVSNKSSVPRYLSQQQHVRLQGMLRKNVTPNPNGINRRKATEGTGGQCNEPRSPRYLFTRTELHKEMKTTTKRAEKVPKQAKMDEKKGRDEMDVFAALDTLQKSMVTKELMTRFCGQRSSPAIPRKEAILIQSTNLDRAMNSNDPFRVDDVFLPQSPAVGSRSATTPLTNSSNSSESNSSSLARFRIGLPIGPAVPGVFDNVEDPSLAEKITRNYESIFLKTLEQMNTSRPSVTPSALSPFQPHRHVSPQLGQFVSEEAVFPEGNSLGGIPHDFQFTSAPQHVPHFPADVCPSNQLMPINYAEGEDLNRRFANTEMEVTELSQLQQSSSLSLGVMTDFDTYLGFGLEEMGDSADLDMTPMMPAEEAEDELDFLRAQMDMLP